MQASPPLRSAVPGPEIDSVCAVVPARNEAGSLARCLRALVHAGQVIEATLSIAVVLDSCTDGSHEVAEQLAAELGGELAIVTTSVASAGAARRVGVRELLRRASAPAQRLWIVSTDADSAVPAHWLGRHLEHARAGALLVAGTVEVDDWSPWSSEVRLSYERRYARHIELEGHGHAHGANLGVRADVYRRLGGFDPNVVNEDADFIRRARRDGVEVTWALDIAVQTSSRAVGRASRGFADYLLGLSGSIAQP